MKQTHTILALFVAVLALPMAAVGQPASTGAASNNETIDDIVVVGQKPLSQLLLLLARNPCPNCVRKSSRPRRTSTRSSTN